MRMVRGAKIRFSKALVKKKMLANAVEIQTTRLCDYAKNEIEEMAKRLSGRYEDQTYNLQDSLVWCVYYGGNLKKHGYYGSKKAKEDSYLHAWGKNPPPQKVDGRALAKAFVAEYHPSIVNGWEIVWAAAAPYSAYLEGGFQLHGRFRQFYVITQRYDHIKRTLEPFCAVDYEINVPVY